MYGRTRLHSCDWMDTVWGIAPGILNWGAVGFFRQVVVSAAITYTLTHVLSFGRV